MTDTPAIRITNTRKASASAFTVGGIRQLIEGAPDNARFIVNQSGGGSQLDPTTTTLTVDLSPFEPNIPTFPRTERTR